MKDILDLLREPNVTIAVVGANNNPNKYGNTIYRDLRRKGYTIFPVNPSATEVEGDKAYAHLAALPVKPTIINFVVPPSVTLNILQECLELGHTNVWLQPGSENDEVLNFLETRRFNYLANACIMIESRVMH